MTEENKNVKILLVDDDRFLLDMYVLKFKSNGIHIDTCASSKAALDKIHENDTYDIILLDIIMPGMDGVELLKTIRDEKLAQKSTIIMLTNQADEIEKVKKIGVDGFIIKATSIPSEVVASVLDIHQKKINK
ncbi:MAG: response regulator [bacterium]